MDNHMQQTQMQLELPPEYSNQQESHQSKIVQRPMLQSSRDPSAHAATGETSNTVPSTYQQQQQQQHHQQHQQLLHYSQHPPHEHDLPPIAINHNQHNLPSLQSILAPLPLHIVDDVRNDPVTAHTHAESWPSMNPYSQYHQQSYASPHSSAMQRLDSPNAMDLDAATPDARRATSVLSIDDPDVRLAAEALGDLRAAMQHNAQPTHPEPLLSLLTTSYPRSLGPIIDASLNTYSASKNYSPVFRSSAETVERGLTPIVNRAGSIGKAIGMEGLARWHLSGQHSAPRHRKPADADSGHVSKRRRKLNNGSNNDVATPKEMTEHQQAYPGDMTPVYRPAPFTARDRRPSQLSVVDSLPAYDEHRSPSYEPNDTSNNEQALIPTKPRSPSWPTRVAIATGGLGAAMSEESLRSLKYCLGCLRWANSRIDKIIESLQKVLQEYDSSLVPPYRLEDVSGREKEEWGMIVHTERSELSKRMDTLRQEVVKTLQKTMDIVSRYGGGILPPNAEGIIRRHLTSLPQRFMWARAGQRHGQNTTGSEQPRSQESEEEEMKDGAKRLLVLAKEGLDMMAQISGILDGTIGSAEGWCETWGRRKRVERDEMSGMAEQKRTETEYETEADRSEARNLEKDIEMG